MTATAPPKGPGDGLQPERTALAWSRTSFGVLGNGALLLPRDLHGHHGPVRLVPAGLAALVALLTYAIGVRRQRALRRRPLPDPLVAHQEIHLLGISLIALIVVTAVILPV